MSGPPPSDDGARATYHRVRGTRKAAFLLTVLAAGLAWWRWRPFRVEVAGRSMEPTLEPRDWALAVRARMVRPGDVVVLELPGDGGREIVKRVIAGPGDRAPDGRELPGDEVWVEGDASDASTDSRTFGPVPSASVRGRVVLVWWPPSRMRRP